MDHENPHQENNGTDNLERQQAEIEFVSAAFTKEEAYCELDHGVNPVVHRLLQLPVNVSASASNNPKDTNDTDATVVVQLDLIMPRTYPETEALQVSIQVMDRLAKSGNKTTASILKLVYDQALSNLLETCRKTASSFIGNEAVFSVLNAADEWIQDTWPQTLLGHQQGKLEENNHHDNQNPSAFDSPMTWVLERRLIYSHHIIAKSKRHDLQQLASHYQLTGYVKIGWPGLLIIEGLEESCQAFYDDIRQWAWQYLVVRGEMQETQVDTLLELNAQRRFTGFQEVSDMSIVAQACREADLEDLFRTSMKVYASSKQCEGEIQNESGDSSNDEKEYYGILIHVDHMNNGKSYRKWLYRNSVELGTWIRVRQITRASLNTTSSSRGTKPLILVLIVGADKKLVGTFMKRWRCSRVDVDAKGQPCLERQMTVLQESYLQLSSSIESAFGVSDSDDRDLETALSDFLELVASVGGPTWMDAVGHLQ